MSVHVLHLSANIFDSDAYAIVVPVNSVGVPGKGLALAAAKHWPAWEREYRRICFHGGLRAGGLSSFVINTTSRPRVVLAVATKDHWRDPSRLEWIENGLLKLAAYCRETTPVTVAVPALGCGLGELLWNDVRPLAERILGDVPGVDFMLYAPHEAPRKARS